MEQLQVSAPSPVPRYFSTTGNLGCTRWVSTQVTNSTEMGGCCEGSFPGYREGLGRCHQEVAHLEMGASKYKTFCLHYTGKLCGCRRRRRKTRHHHFDWKIHCCSSEGPDNYLCVGSVPACFPIFLPLKIAGSLCSSSLRICGHMANDFHPTPPLTQENAVTNFLALTLHHFPQFSELLVLSSL